MTPQLGEPFGDLLEWASDVVYAYDLDGNFLSMNAAGERILGYTPAEVVQMNIADLFPELQPEAVKGEIGNEARAGGFRSYETGVVAKSGAIVPVEVSSRLVVRDGRPVAFVGIARDLREHRYRGLVEHTGDAKALIDPAGTITYVSTGGARLLGLGAQDLTGISLFDMVHPDDVERARGTLANVSEVAGGVRGEMRFMDGGGGIRWLAFTAVDALGDPAIGAIVFDFFDVTDRKGNERRLVELVGFQNALMSLVEESLQEGLSEDFYGRVLACAVDVIPGAQAGSLLARDDQGRCHFVAAEGFDLEALGRTFLYEYELHRNPGESGPQVVMGFERKKMTDAHRSEILYDAGRGADIVVTLSTPIELEGTPVMYFHLDNFDDRAAFSDDAVNMARAFSNHIAILLKRFRLEADLRQERIALDTMAYTDALTGLPNRRMFYRRANDAVAGMHADSLLAVLFFDLDAFKEVNDTLGHQLGDVLLEAVGRRLLACVREGDTVSRWGGDEFVLLLPEAGSRQSVEQLAERIIERINAPFSVGDQLISIGCSIGVAFTRHEAGVTIDELTRDADIALYRAKEEGRNRFRLFSEIIRAGVAGRGSLERALEQAIENRSLGVTLGPRLNLAPGTVECWIAELVWEHPTLGRVDREAFLGTVDQDSLAGAAFDYLLDSVCERLGRASVATEEDRIAIAMWPALFREQGLLASIDATLRRHRVESSRLELCIPEGCAMRGRAETRALLHELSGLGLRLSVFGFGSSPTSVEALGQVPVDTLVVAPEIVHGLVGERRESSRQTLRVLLAIACALEKRVVADGVDTSAHAEALEDFDVDLAQGAWFATRSAGSAADSDVPTGILTLPGTCVTSREEKS